MSSERSKWDLSEVIDLSLHPKLLIWDYALWEAFDFHAGSFMMSHIRAKGLEKHSISSANISLRHQLLQLHLADCNQVSEV